MTDLAWLDELPAERLPADYAGWYPDAVRAEYAGRSREAQVVAEQARLSNALSAALADPSGNALDAATVASELAAIDLVREYLPTVQVVPLDAHDAVVQALTNDMTLPPVPIPLIAAELKHYQSEHARHGMVTRSNAGAALVLPPGRSDQDDALLAAYEAAMMDLSTYVRQLASLREPVQAGQVATRVAAILSVRSEALVTSRNLANQIQGVTVAVNDKRISDGRAHRCPNWNNKLVDPGVTPINGKPWRLADWLVDGVAVKAA